MAEAWARQLGEGVLEPSSAGLFPARIVQPETFQVMAERDVILHDRPPRPLYTVDGSAVDVVVNMVPAPATPLLPGFTGREIAWKVRDPIGQPIETYRAVRDQIERQVKELIEELRP